MKTTTIKHYESKEAYQTNCSGNDIMTSDLISYSFEGDYVFIVKSRYSKNDIIINIPQYLELVNCTLKNKPYDVEEKKSSNDFVRNIWNSRLKKLEDDLFPSGYADCPGINPWRAAEITERLSRIEKKLGIYKEEGCDLNRLEKCEFSLDHIKLRLNNLDVAVFSTREEIYSMKTVITLDGQFKRLEEKLGVNLAFVDMNHRLKHIEDAWKAHEWHYGSKNKMPYTKETPYVCLILKHQQALQDALQEKFGEKKEWIKSPNGGYDIIKTYVPKFKEGDVVVCGKFEFKISSVGYLRGEAVYHIGNCPTSCFYIDTNFTLKSTTYVPKYHIGDILEFNYEHGKEIKKISKVGVFYKTQPNIPFYCFTDGSAARDCESVDKDNCSIFKVT